MGETLENFERAFSSNGGSCRKTCECGREFYNPEGGWNWEDGEIERLEKSNATPLEWSVGGVWFGGKDFVPDCDCWHKRAKNIIAFLNAHGQSIANFFELEHKRKMAEATASPLISKEAIRDA